MEIRHVRKRTQRRRKSSFSPALILMCAVSLAIVYGIGASKFGTWLAARVVAPAIIRVMPTETPEAVISSATPAIDTRADTLSITLPAVLCYAVQIGVYGERDNANAQSESLRKLGAAGYIAEDGEHYRVLAAGYPDSASMDKVRAQLLSSGIESRAYEIVTDGLRLRVSGDAEALDGLEAALSFAAALPEELSEAAIRFDRESLDVFEGREMIRSVLDDCLLHMAVFESMEEPTRAALAPAADYLSDVAASMEALSSLDGEDTVRFSSAVKRLYLDAVFGYQRMASEMENG